MKGPLKLYSQYMDDVISGKEVTGELSRLAVERQLNDLDKAARGEVEYYFDEKAAARMLKFSLKMKHTKGKLAGKPFDLQPFQAFRLATVFGWINDNEDKDRRYTSAYNELARKGGKTAEAGLVANFSFAADKDGHGNTVQGREVYSFATKRPQAKIVWQRSKSMLNRWRKEELSLKNYFTILSERMSIISTEAIFEPLPADSDKLDGLHPDAVIFDECHEYKDWSGPNVIRTGQGTSISPLLWYITTAGFNINSPCYAYRSVIVNILRGIKVDPTTFGCIYTLDDTDDWHDEEVWKKANPNIGNAPSWKYMRDMYAKAVNEGRTAEVNFLTKNLNKWMTTSATWIPDREWMSSGSNFDMDILLGRECWIGLDLSTTKDLTCMVFLFKPIPADPKFRCKWHFYCPEDSIERRSITDGVPYIEWSEKGLIQSIPGKVVDYDYILDDIEAQKNKYKIRACEYDPALAYFMRQKIENLGVSCTPYPQENKYMEPVISQIEILIAGALLDHGNHPIARWNASNVFLQTNNKGHRRIDKSRVTDRVDGMSALCNAIGGFVTDEGAPIRSKYEDENLGGV